MGHLARTQAPFQGAGVTVGRCPVRRPLSPGALTEANDATQLDDIKQNARGRDLPNAAALWVTLGAGHTMDPAHIHQPPRTSGSAISHDLATEATVTRRPLLGARCCAMKALCQEQRLVLRGHAQIQHHMVPGLATQLSLALRALDAALWKKRALSPMRPILVRAASEANAQELTAKHDRSSQSLGKLNREARAGRGLCRLTGRLWKPLV